MSPPIIEARALVKEYGRGASRFTVVAGVDLTVGEGEIVGIQGPSGCGKSTLLRLLTTAELPTAGTVRLGGALVMHRRQDGFVMPITQNPTSALDPRWPVWRSITEPLLAVHRKPHPNRRVRREIAQARLSTVGLDSIDIEARPRQLSGGQCQRIAILRALVADPRLLVADEPTSALDVSVGAGVLRLLAEAASRGIAIVIASHDRAALSVLCDRVFAMDRGTLQVIAADRVPQVLDVSVGQ